MATARIVPGDSQGDNAHLRLLFLEKEEAGEMVNSFKRGLRHKREGA
jgi:hypothetical protein